MNTKAAIKLGEKLVSKNFCFRSKAAGDFENDDTLFTFSVIFF